MNKEKITSFGEGQSPLPNIPNKGQETTPIKELDFYDAMKMAVSGYIITRRAWDTGWYGIMGDELLELHKPDGVVRSWIINLGDVQAVDWYVMPRQEIKA